MQCGITSKSNNLDSCGIIITTLLIHGLLLFQIFAHLKHNPLVIGNDLRNEIRSDYKNSLFATWGDGNETTDWKLAAT